MTKIWMKDGQHKIHHSQRQRGSFEGSQRKISHSKIHHTQHEGRFPHKGVCHCMSILGKRRKLRDPIQVGNCLLCSILHKQIHEGWHEFQNHVRQYFGACSRQMVFKNKSAYNRYFSTALQADVWRQKSEDPSLPITCEMLGHLRPICMKLEEHAQLEISRMLGHGPRGSHGRSR